MRDTEILINGGRLLMIYPALPDPTLAPAVLVAVGEHRFRIETNDGFGNYGELAVFEMDGAGRVIRLRIGPNYSERIEGW